MRSISFRVGIFPRTGGPCSTREPSTVSSSRRSRTIRTSRRRKRRCSSPTKIPAGSAAPISRRSAPAPAITRQKDPSATLAPVPANNSFAYTLVTPQLSVSYVPDVFGLNKRTVEAAAAQEQASRYQMIAVDITLSANVAEAVIEEASLQDQIDTTNELIGISREILSLLQYQKSKGYVAGPRSFRSRRSWRNSRPRCRR